MVCPCTVTVATSGLSMTILLVGVSIITLVTSSSCWTCMPMRCIILFASRGLTFPRRIIVKSISAPPVWCLLRLFGIGSSMPDLHCDSYLEALHLYCVEEGSPDSQQPILSVHYQDFLFRP